MRERSGADYVIAESGLAGPVAGRSPKPIGSVAFALAGPEGGASREVRFEGSRVAIMEQIADYALTMLVEALDSGS